jgi:hypothetical protein
VGFNFNSPAVNTGSASILEQSIHDSGSSVQFFKDPTAALATLKFPQNGTIGTRNALRGNRFSNVDLAILKNFRLGESETRRLQFRWEMYNAFNYNVFALPNVSITSTSFGLITGSASAPREMQFALRLEF